MEGKDIAYALGILATAIIGIWNAYSNIVTSKKTRKITTVTTERIKWANDFRRAITGLCANIYLWLKYKKENQIFDIYKSRSEVRFLLSPYGDKNIDIDEKITSLLGYIGKAEVDNGEYNVTISTLLNDVEGLAKDILQNEWQRIKNEAE